MCLGEIARLEDVWDDGVARVGRIDDGSLVSLAFVPEAEPGTHVLVHLGIPVEVLDAETVAEALALRSGARVDREDARP